MKAGDLLFLDAQVVGVLAHPRGGDEPRRCRAWARRMIEGGVRLFLAEVSDYEVRRELIRLGATAGLRRLDQLRLTLDFAPITTGAMGVAARLWAESRRRGLPTGSSNAVDCDVILAAQALQAAGPNRSVAVASANVRHLEQFLDVRPWDRFDPDPSEPSGQSDISWPLVSAPGHMD